MKQTCCIRHQGSSGVRSFCRSIRREHHRLPLHHFGFAPQQNEASAIGGRPDPVLTSHHVCVWGKGCSPNVARTVPEFVKINEEARSCTRRSFFLPLD